MNKKIKLGLWLIFGIIILVVLGVAGSYGYAKWRVYSYKQNIKQPYIQDARTSLGGDTPLEAYKQFREQLQQGNKEKALQYIFISEREEYRKDMKGMKEEDMVKKYLDMPSAKELSKESERPCGQGTLACQKRADFYYEYKVKGKQKEIKINENTKFITESPGMHKRHLYFIKNLKGKWQIYNL